MRQMGWKYCPSERVFSSSFALLEENTTLIFGHRMSYPGSEEWGMQSYDGESNSITVYDISDCR